MPGTLELNRLLLEQRPIPLEAGEIPKGWRDIEIAKPSDELLVPVGPFGTHGRTLFTSSIYAAEHIHPQCGVCAPYARTRLPGAGKQLFLRPSIAERLETFQNRLPAGQALVLFDGYRTAKTQESLYNHFYKQLAAQKPGIDDETLHHITQRFVSLPSQDPPSPHLTGGAVDAALVYFRDPADFRDWQDINKKLRRLRENQDPFNREWRALELIRSSIMQQSIMLRMGTAFDHGGEAANLTHYEQRAQSLNRREKAALYNRRWLYWAAQQQDLFIYAAEWWHFDAIETQRGAAAAGQPDKATFGAALFTTELENHELRRGRVTSSSEWRIGGHWPAEIIAPPQKKAV